MSKTAIKVDNLHIKYTDLKRTSLRNSWLNFKKEKDVYEALKGITFKLEKGQILGIIGKNGSGKSTLLKTIAGIFSPDEGSVDIFDNTVSLLSIGVGFNKKLTGRDNIYLSGLLLGFDEARIKEKEKSIIEFADIGDFIDKPVRTYSSGMYSKLAFSITAILETDILLIDEVLSVGDTQFKQKSYNKMKELIKDKDRTVVLVSHDLDTISDLCDKVLWISDGKIKSIGNTEKILQEYKKFIEKKKNN